MGDDFDELFVLVLNYGGYRLRPKNREFALSRESVVENATDESTLSIPGQERRISLKRVSFLRAFHQGSVYGNKILLFYLNIDSGYGFLYNIHIHIKYTLKTFGEQYLCGRHTLV